MIQIKYRNRYYDKFALWRVNEYNHKLGFIQLEYRSYIDLNYPEFHSYQIDEPPFSKSSDYYAINQHLLIHMSNNFNEIKEGVMFFTDDGNFVIHIGEDND